MTDQPQHPPGATLHLGGDAYAHPDLEQATVPIEPTPTSQGLTADPPLTPYPGNPRRGDQDAITASLRDLGLYRPVIVQRSTGHVLAGNHTLRALRDLGAVRVPVTWVDVDNTRAAAIVIRDNYTAGLGVDDPTDLLALLTADEEVLALSGRDAEDVAVLTAQLEDGPPAGDDAGAYTRKIDSLRYYPTQDTPPPPAALVDRTRTNDLLRQIADADVPDDVRDFLQAGAQRHLTFDYAQVAEFYAHATPEVQQLMEVSALVIVDFNDAIQHGYVRLSDRLAELRALDTEAPPSA